MSGEDSKAHLFQTLSATLSSRLKQQLFGFFNKLLVFCPIKFLNNFQDELVVSYILNPEDGYKYEQYLQLVLGALV